MDRPTDTDTGTDAGTATGTGTVPRSVDLAIRAAWSLVGVLGLTVAVMAVFNDQVVGAWADHHEGAREAFDQGGRLGLERAGFATPSFLPVAATMIVVGAMIVWVLASFLRRGYRWGQLGLFATVLGCVYASIALGFVLGPPPVFVAVAVLSLLVEGVTVVCLWHPDTRAHVRGPWVGGPGPGAGAASAGSFVAAEEPTEGPVSHSG
ncbi:MAG TPA: hypothetical protein VGK78_04620 [Nocardioides sp.]|uniref:hypothetical protein n=1 Tax=Nocardioides sp. TaxID=35761 RepID=UPI002F410D42